MPKIFILGSRGFVGSRILKNLSESSEYDLVGYGSKECDLLNLKSIELGLENSSSEDIIVVASCITRLRENSYESMKKNIDMTYNLVKFLENHPIKQLIFFSSVDVYGLVDDSVTISEKLLPNPHDYYAISKITSEYVLKKGLRCSLTILRFSGIYGPGTDCKSMINTLISRAKEKGKISIYGDGSDSRDLVFVDDIYRIVEESIKNNITGTINIATGVSRSVNEIVDLIKECIDVSVDFKPATGELRQRLMSYNIDYFRKLYLGFKYTDLRQGLCKYF